MEKPLLSVCLITYKHARYIRQAIDGILSQKVNFPFEVIIADDCSPDDTQEILKEYQQRHPQLIRLILQEKNVGPAKNWLQLITAPESKYIAYFEGDDYWTDPLKLQKQVDFLEGHADCSLCFHKVKTIDDNGKDCGDIYEIDNNFSKFTTIEDLARRNYIPSVSMVFRNLPFVKNLPGWFFRLPMGDWPLLLLAAETGKIGFIDEEMAVYRKHGSGTWSSVDFVKNHKKVMDARKIMDEAFNRRYHEYFFCRKDMQKTEEMLMQYFRETRKPVSYFRSYFNLLFSNRQGEYSWGYFYVLFFRYFSKVQ